MSTTYTIICAILGETTSFPIEIESSKIVGILKDMIKEKKPNRFASVDADELTLYRVNISGSKEARIEELKTMADNFGQQEELDALWKLTKIYSTAPPEETIHIIVRPPQTGRKHGYKTPENQPGSLPKLNHTPEARAPPDPTTVQASIDAFVEQKLCPEIRKYLQGPRVSYWSPPKAVTQETQDFYTTLEVPLIGEKPSLLLHRLQESPNPNGDHVFNGRPSRPHTIYCAVSGSGKTRVIFEGLSSNYGFYFVAARGTDGIGSRDLEAMTSLMCDHRDWVQGIFKNQAPNEVLHANTTNESIATRAIFKVVLARWIIFKAFIETARVHNGGTLPTDIKQDWLLFQVLPDVLIHQLDPFLAFIDTCLSGVDIETLRPLRVNLGLGLKQILGPQFNNDKFFYVLDEVQVLGKQYLGCFSDAEGKLPRPVLRPTIQTLTSDLTIPVIVSGTGFSLDNFKVVLNSGIGKDSGWETHYTTGDFTNPEIQTQYIQRYLPPAFLCSDSGRALLDRMYRWLRGRHRFTARFIEALLTGAWHETGPAAPHKQLNTYIHRLSGCTPHDGENVFVEQEPNVKAIRVDTFMWEKIDAHPNLLTELAQSFYMWMTQGKFPLWWKEQQSLVEYGLARFIWTKESTIAEASTDSPEVTIQEPLALVSILNHWQSRDLSLLNNIRTRFQSNQGTAFEEVLVFAMTKMLQNESPLRTIFTFFGTTPSWARSTAQIMAKTSSGALETFKDHQLNSPLTEIVLRAENLDEVKQWLQHGPAAWCIPPTTMGPDLMAWVKLGNGKALLLVIQAKCWFTGNIETLVPKVGADAIRTTIPANFFASITSDDNKQRRTAMLEAINPQMERYTNGRYNILRVVAAYPLDVNFKSVSADIQTALGEDNHALAKLSNLALVSTLANYPEGTSIVSMLAGAVKNARKLEGDDEGGSRSPSKKRKLGEQGEENSMVLT